VRAIPGALSGCVHNKGTLTFSKFDQRVTITLPDPEDVVALPVS
jgi:hypothetical protein